VKDSYFLRTFLAAVLFAFGACGERPSPATDAGRPKTPKTETSGPQAVPATIVPSREGGRTDALGRSLASVSKPETLPDVIKKVFPSAVSVRSESAPFPHRVIKDSAGLVLGFEAFSDSAGVTARGYAGMVPVQVFFNERGRPVRIYILENCETPAYLDLAYGAGLLEKLLAFDPAKPDSIDVVTLATSSSKALIDGVTGLAARVLAELVPPGRGTR